MCLKILARKVHLVHRLASQLSFRRLSMDFSDMRKPYKSDGDGFVINDLASKDPYLQFAKWHEEAVVVEASYETNAACLATCSSSGQPSARMVLLKSYDHDGFRFFTNYCSKKAADLLANPKAALLVYWETMSRQVRVEGSVEKLPMEVADAYFQRRPRESQLSAAVSPQSAVVRRQDLVEKYKALSEEYGKDEVVPKPETWGGFLLKPQSIEFWQGQTSRLHDRIRFRKPEPGEKPDGDLLHEGLNGWVFETLAP